MIMEVLLRNIMNRDSHLLREHILEVESFSHPFLTKKNGNHISEQKNMLQ